MEIEDEIIGNNIKDEVRKFYLLEREWISLTYIKIYIWVHISGTINGRIIQPCIQMHLGWYM
jgi:hypothetical protein